MSSLVALVISESTTLFGFMEVGYRPAIVLSIALEGATIVLLAAPLAGGALRRAAGPAHST